MQFCFIIIPTLIACDIATVAEYPSNMYDVGSLSGEDSFSRLF